MREFECERRIERRLVAVWYDLALVLVTVACSTAALIMAMTLNNIGLIITMLFWALLYLVIQIAEKKELKTLDVEYEAYEQELEEEFDEEESSREGNEANSDVAFEDN